MHTAALEKPKDVGLLQMDADWGDVCGAVREEARGYRGAFNPCVYVKGVRKFVLNLSTDSKNHGRLLIASTDGIGQNAQHVIDRQEK